MFLLRSFSMPGMVKCVVGTMVVMFALPAMAAIEGSVHDLSASGFTGGEICNVCHVPHNTNATVQAPLWNHTISTATYDIYTSPTMAATAEQPAPGGLSRMCLSCHDGTVAVDSFGGSTGTTFIDPRANLGTDLSNDHPIGIRWLHVESNQCLNCHGIPVTGPRGKELKFIDGKVECPTCHDVHNEEVQGVKLLRKTLVGSELCFHCHQK
ncbi:MAG: cytochrome C [Candidatus Thiodiazotropha sp. (ex Epidulcina cf. delphinae)]|nr:cytochrome C [Candidatus Thiodiazotropha sp. (ex Epidulcina cf. delphinae)]